MNPVLTLWSPVDRLLAGWGLSLWLLALRLYVGWQFFHSGMLKLADWDSTLALFESEYAVPLLPPHLAAVAGAAGELLLPPLLFVGLLTRPAALALAAVNAVAVISYPALFGFECPAAIQSHAWWGAALIGLGCAGGGRLSLDAWRARHRCAD
ncbi:DoxX family protein [Derxia gummosa]|uniref:DoxX family protein n=1 Tax=Derxia gummosa DSM 723 TaxID=1121388 RepID=A0A8B6X226_9BURK|nr:DoxX family protein [Derxia gummosa]